MRIIALDTIVLFIKVLSTYLYIKKLVYKEKKIRKLIYKLKNRFLLVKKIDIVFNSFSFRRYFLRLITKIKVLYL